MWVYRDVMVHGAMIRCFQVLGIGGVCTEEESNMESDGGAVAVGGHVIRNRR